MDDEVAKLTRERDLFRQLLELGLEGDAEALLAKALSLFIDTAGARRGCLEVRQLSDEAEVEPYFMMRGMDEEALAENGFSRSVINETLATGETVLTASAMSDPRFQEQRSVRMQKLEAVLCTPIGAGPVTGVIYLQDRIAPGPFTPDDQRRAEFVARHLAGFAERVLAQRKRALERDRTQPIRRLLKVDAIVGSSAALSAALQQVALVAPLNIGVLLTGPSGTGKTQLARAIHDNGPRASGPFVELNCAALPDDLVESELFGAVAGGHSTATRRLAGKVEAAERGTLFLDEIGDLPIRSQAKLLQLLQSGIYYPIGASVPNKANIRLIAATNLDLNAAVAEKRFREDLYYRLSAFPIRMPTLAERREDVAPLARHFCRSACETNGLTAMELSAGAILALEYAEWQGNVRELASVVTAAVVRAHGENSQRVERRHVFPDDRTASALPSDQGALTFQQALRMFQERFLHESLERAGWNIAAVARSLDLTRSHVYNLMATLNIRRP